MSQKILIELSYEDQIFVENECLLKGHTLSSFITYLLQDYKNKATLNKEETGQTDGKVRKTRKSKK